MTIVYLSNHAIQDIEAIHQYSINQWGKSTAAKYLDDIQAGFDRLQTYPELLRQSAISTNFYSYSVRKHTLICDKYQEDIFILTLINSNMDLPNRLIELEPLLLQEMAIMHQKINKQTPKPLN